MEYSEGYNQMGVKTTLLLSVPVTVPTKLSEWPELLKTSHWPLFWLARLRQKFLRLLL